MQLEEPLHRGHYKLGWKALSVLLLCCPPFWLCQHSWHDISSSLHYQFSCDELQPGVIQSPTQKGSKISWDLSVDEEKNLIIWKQGFPSRLSLLEKFACSVNTLLSSSKFETISAYFIYGIHQTLRRCNSTVFSNFTFLKVGL